MNLQHLKYALEVSRTGSITRAAESLFMAQPNLSKAIRELEELVGYNVFERSPKGVVPTQKGMELLKYARSILGQVDSILALSDYNDPDMQCLRVAAAGGTCIPDIVNSIIRRSDMTKGLHLSIMETDSMQVINNVSTGQCDLGVIRYLLTYEQYFLDYLASRELTGELIWEFENIAIMSTDHPLAQSPGITSGDLSEYIQIVREDRAVPYLPVDSINMSEESLNTRKRIYMYEYGGRLDLLTTLPNTYMWDSPVPQTMLDRYGLVQMSVSLDGNLFRDMLIMRPGHPMTDFDRIFAELLFRSRGAEWKGI